VALLSFIRLLSTGEAGFGLWGFPSLIGVLALIAIMVSWNSVGNSLERLKPDAFLVLRNRQYQPKLRWRDFYASHDPVSNGSLSATIAANVSSIVSRKVMVLASLLGDHTAYWTSRADFLPRVVAALNFCAGAGLFADRSAVRGIVAARGTYRRWVRFLWVSRWAATASLFLPLFAFDRVRLVAADLHDGLHRLPVASIVGVIDGLDKAFGWLGALVLGQPGSGEGVTAILLVSIVSAGALYVWGRIVAYWWQHTATLLMTPMFMPSRDQAVNRLGSWLLVAWVATLAALPPALSAAWTFAPQEISWQTLFRFLAMFATLACMLGWFFLLLGLVFMTRELAAKVIAARKANSSWVKALRSIPDLWIGPFAWFAFGVGGGSLLWQNRYAPVLWQPAIVLVAIGVAAHFFLRRPAR